MKYLILLLCLMSFKNGHAQNRLIPFRVQHKWGYADVNKKLVIKPIFDDASIWNCRGHAKVKINGQVKWIDTAGKFIEADEQVCGPGPGYNYGQRTTGTVMEDNAGFGNGGLKYVPNPLVYRIPVEAKKRSKYASLIRDYVGGLFVIEDGAYYKMVDTFDNVLTPFHFKFYRQMAPNGFIIELDNRLHYFVHQGTTLKQTGNYDIISYFPVGNQGSLDDYLFVEDHGKSGLLKPDGTEVLAPVCDSIKVEPYAYFEYFDGKKHGLVSYLNGKTVSTNFDRVSWSQAPGTWLLTAGKKTGFYSSLTGIAVQPKYDSIDYDYNAQFYLSDLNILTVKMGGQKGFVSDKGIEYWQ